MSGKKIFVLLFLVLVLGIGAFILKRDPETPLEVQAGFTDLSLSPSLKVKVKKIVLSADRPLKEVNAQETNDSGEIDILLSLVETENGWQIPEYFDGKVKEKNIDDLFKEIETLKGEFRSADESVLPDYMLDRDQAVILSLYGADSPTPLYALILGKQTSGRNNFVRKPGESTVYIVDHNLLGLLGGNPMDLRKKPDPKSLIDFTLFTIDDKDFKHIAFTTPNLAFSLKNNPIEPPRTNEADATSDKDKTKREYYLWSLDQPSEFPFELNISAGRKLAEKLNRLKGEDLVANLPNYDPKGLAEFGFDQPSRQIILTDKSDHRIGVQVGKSLTSNNSKEFYLKKLNELKIYKVRESALDELFLHSGEIFNLKPFTLTKENIQRIDYQGTKTYKITRKSVTEPWKLVGVQVKPLDQQKIVQLVDKLSSLDGYGFEADPAERIAVDTTITLQSFAGKTEIFQIGQEGPGQTLRCAISSAPLPILVRKSQTKPILPEFSDLIAKPQENPPLKQK